MIVRISRHRTPGESRSGRIIVGRRFGTAVAAIAIAIATGGATVGAAGDLPPSQPVPSLPALSGSPATDDAVSSRLFAVPAGCPEPAREQAVFIGTMVLGDAATARLRVDQMRAGDLDGYTVGGLVDVRYGDDVRFLSVGTRYLVGVVADPQTRVLVSRVRAEAPLFGGSQIEGVPGDECPQVPDPVRTLQLDGGAVDTGVLSPLAERPVSILAAVGIAVAAVLGALVVLAALRLTFAASLAALRRVR